MQKKAAVGFVLLILVCSSLQSFSQVAQDPLDVRPTERVFKPIDDNERVTLTGNRHPLAIQEYSTGQMSPEKRMEHMVLVLKGNAEQEAALEVLTQAQQDPDSPYYHQWLTPEQFAERFGASAGDVRQIGQWLQIHGMEVEETPSNRAIVFSGTAGQVESTFHTNMQTYLVKGEQHYANATEPEIPVALSAVVHGVLSLHDFVSSPMHVSVPAFTSGSAHYLMPGDWATIYDVTPLYNQSITGSGQSIAVLGRVDITMSDVQTFRTDAGLPANNPTIITNGADPGGVGSSDWVESSLDVEWAGAIAKNATVKFVTSKSGSSDGISLSAQYAVTNKVAPIITLSYGACEQAEGAGGNSFWNGLWQQAAAEGISVFVSSGDSGAAGCDSSSATTATQGRGVNALCSSPYSTCVGGLEFVEGSNAGQYWTSTNGSGMASALSYIPEATWNESGSSGLWSGGGGVSTVYTKPSWQSAPGVPSDGMRDVPDVAMSAAMHDGYVIVLQGGLSAVGGTSAAAPSLASAMALVVQDAGAAQGNLNPILYKLAALQLSASGAAVFHDITSGNNSVPGVTGFTAGTGYDQATGLGSINASLLVNHWGDASATFGVTAASSSLTVGAGSSNTVKLTLAASNGFSSPVTLSYSGAPTGVTVSFSSATLSATSAVTATISASGSAAAGNSTITITGTSGGVSHTATIALTITAPNFTLTPNATSSTLTAGTPSTLTFTTAAQTGFSAAVALTISGLPKGVTAAFSPASIASPGNGSSTLTFTGAASAVTAGSATVTVSATGGGVTKTQAISLTVEVPNFTLTPSATSSTLTVGTPATLKFTTAGQTGFSAAVALSVTGSPSGVTAAFSPASIASPGNGSSTLTFTGAATAVTAGSATVTVTATGGGVTKTQAISLTVVVPSFTLAANATSGSVTAGSTKTFALTTGVVGGFSSGVALSVSGLPKGVTAVFSPTSVNSPGNGSSTMTLTAASSATLGSTALTVSGTGGGVTKTVAISLTVTAPAPAIALSSNTVSANVAGGGHTSFTLTTAAQNFSAAVALSVTGLPRGVTAAFSPASIASPGSGSSTLTLTATTAATVGSATVTVTATGGGATKTLPLSVTVPAANSARASSISPATVKIGAKTNVDISGLWLSGFASTITFSASGLPKGVTATFDPARIAANDKSGTTLTLAAGTNAIAGITDLTITATSAGISRTQALSLTVSH
jgi:subtilase family serine protease